ncbi:MAG: DUF3857 domain-containing protein [Bacteroidales bacterium]|nr:DUF3857 domain-containing protein [Bacteroidales bacterium]
MRSILSFTLTLLCSGYLFSQNFSKDYGKVTKDEIRLAQYPGDNSAQAAVLYDIGRSRFMHNENNSFDVVFERSTKIKIFTDAGLKYAEIKIPYHQDNDIYETVTKIEATTYNLENGEMMTATKLDVKNTFTQKINDRWNYLVFALPNVKAGSVIEYKYTLTSPSKFYLRDWEFQREIPVKYSMYRVDMVPFYQYTYLLQGAGKFDIYNNYENRGLVRYYGPLEYHENIHEYIMTDVPAFVDEGFITSQDDYIIKLDFQLSAYYDVYGVETKVLSTWPQLCNDILKDDDFGRYIKSASGKHNDIIAKLKTESATDKELIEKLTDYVKANYSWNGRNSWFALQSFKEYQKTKTGNSAEINLHLLSLVQDAGFTAYPVLLSTRDNGKIKFDFPFVHFFNYIVVFVEQGDEILMLDATEPLLPYSIIPPKCINDKGLVVKKKAQEWIELANKAPSANNRNIFIGLNNTADSIRAIVTITTDGFEAFNLRKQLNNDEKKLEQYIENKHYSDVSEIKTFNFFERNSSFIVSYKGNLPVDRVNDKIYIRPFINETIKDNPLKQQDRQYPIDFTYPQMHRYSSMVLVPEGYTVEYLPADVKIDNNNFSLTYNTTSQNNSVTIIAQYCFKKAVYEADEYKMLKYYFAELILKLNDRIVLTKVE